MASRSIQKKSSDTETENEAAVLWSSSGKRPVSDNTDKRQASKRLRQTTIRFGQTEFDVNDDEIFIAAAATEDEQLELLAQSNSTEATEECAENDLLNDDHLFEKAASNRAQTNSTEAVDKNANVHKHADMLQHLTQGEKVLFQMLMDMRTEVKVLQKTMINIELNYGSNNDNKRVEYGIISKNELEQLGLPLTDENGIIGFNTRLKGKKFFDEVFNTFKAVGGDDGNADGEKVTTRIFEQMFTKELIPKMTWTGKCGEIGQTKIRFRKFEQLVELLRNLGKGADKKFTAEKLHSVLVYKLLKYAYKKAPKKGGVKGELVETTESVEIDDSFVIVLPSDDSNTPNNAPFHTVHPYQLSNHQPQYQMIASTSGQHYQRVQPQLMPQLMQFSSKK